MYLTYVVEQSARKDCFEKEKRDWEGAGNRDVTVTLRDYNNRSPHTENKEGKPQDSTTTQSW